MKYLRNFMLLRVRFIPPLMLLLLVLVSSCGKQKSHTFEIINNSGYHITQLSFSGAISGEELSIDAGDTAQNLTLSYEKRLRVTSKLICLSIDDFNGSGSFSVINNGSCLPFSEDDLNDNINTIIITSVENGGEISFEIALN